VGCERGCARKGAEEVRLVVMDQPPGGAFAIDDHPADGIPREAAVARSAGAHSRVLMAIDQDPPLAAGGAGAAGSNVPPGRQLKVAERAR
jgi:hypothetical protein